MSVFLFLGVLCAAGSDAGELRFMSDVVVVEIPVTRQNWKLQCWGGRGIYRRGDAWLGLKVGAEL